MSLGVGGRSKVEVKSLTMMKKEIRETIAWGNLVPMGPMD